MKSLQISVQITDRKFSSIEKYFSEVSKIEMVSADEEAYLAQRIKMGDQVALNKLVKANLRFVISVAKQYHSGSSFSLGDLISEGNLGLVKAAQRFDETRGFKFISYAVWWIRQSIMQAINQKNRLIRLPLNKVNELGKISRASVSLEQTLEREPTNDEISEIIDLDKDDVRDIRLISKFHFSLDSPMGSDDSDLSLGDTIPDANCDSPESELLKSSLNSEINRALSNLKTRERWIIINFYGLGGNEPMTLETLGEKMSLTTERVRQIKHKGLVELKSITRNNRALLSFL